MSIYQRKKYWKTGLSTFAILLFIASWWYTNALVKHISERERTRVEAWAQEIQSKAQLVSYTDDLFKRISIEERKKGELWAKGVQKLISTNDPNADYDFLFDVVRNNETVPVILTNGNNEITNYRNLEFEGEKPSKTFLLNELQFMKDHFQPLVINLPNGKKNFLYYKDSKIFTDLKIILDQMNHTFISEVVLNSASVPVILTDSTQTEIINSGFIKETKPNNLSKEEYLHQLFSELKNPGNPIPIKIEIKTGEVNYIFYKDSFLVEQLKYFPFIQITVVIVFVLIGYFMFSSFRKAEQNQVWVGMSKETAHQLGTPISSMMAWTEMLKDKYPNEKILHEFDKDVSRLEVVADRFSKIGSHAKLEETDIIEFTSETLDYLKNRLSKQVEFIFNVNNEVIIAKINKPLFSWVIENITKNAVDAMTGKGTLTISLEVEGNKLNIDFRDTGKGMTKKQMSTVFQPGYTTKSRGWGLGLTLVKRIVENYHNGKVFVQESTVNKGSIFRIVLSLK